MQGNYSSCLWLFCPAELSSVMEVEAAQPALPSMAQLVTGFWAHQGFRSILCWSLGVTSRIVWGTWMVHECIPGILKPLWGFGPLFIVVLQVWQAKPALEQILSQGLGLGCLQYFCPDFCLLYCIESAITYNLLFSLEWCILCSIWQLLGMPRAISRVAINEEGKKKWKHRCWYYP